MKYLFITALAAIAINSVHAQEAPAPLWHGDVEFGFHQLEGNTDEKSVVGKASGKRKNGLWTYDINASAQNNETEGVRSAENYLLANRLAYDVSDENYTFGFASAEKDRFSGYKYQGTLSAGYGRRLLKGNAYTWDAEIGPGVRVSELEDSDEGQVTEAILRLSTEFTAALSETATFGQNLSVEKGDENTVSKSETSIKTKIVGGLGLKLSYSLTYNEVVPSDTVHMDRETAVTLVYNF
ncbi:MAG: DUF481 domain-containing protein [Spongiibacteraceae bacterium]